MTRRPVALAGLVVLAMALRVGAIAYTHATSAPPEENRLIARNLRAGRGFTFTQFGVTGPTAIRGPVYPMLLTVLRPDWMTFVLGFNVLCGGASVVAAFALARRIAPFHCALAGGAWEKTAGLAAILFAVWPTQVYAATVAQGLSLAVVLLLACLAIAAGGTPVRMIVAGLLGGLAALTEPVLAVPILLAAPLMAGPLSQYAGRGLGRGPFDDASSLNSAKTPSPTVPRRYTGKGSRAALTALFLAAALVPVVPWLYRNAIVFGHPMPITSNFWRDAFLGNGDDASGQLHVTGRHGPNGSDVYQTRVDHLSSSDYDRLKQSEPERIDWMHAQVAEWIVAYPKSYGVLSLGRLTSSLSGLWMFLPSGSALTTFYSWLRIVEMAGCLGLLRRACRGTGRRLVLALLIGLLIIPTFTLAEPRQVVLTDVPLLLGWSIAAATAARKAAA